MKKRKTLLVGLGKSGKSAANFLRHHTQDILYGYDDNLSYEDIIHQKIFPLRSVQEIETIGFTRAIVSPGIAHNHPVFQKLKQKQIKISSEIEIVIPKIKDQLCIGITGSNGKTTAVEFLSHIVNQSHLSAQAVGNNGFALADYVMQKKKNDVLFIELSSFQIELLSTRFLDYAILLNITPDHLDRYRDFADYAKAKLHIMHLLKKSGILWVAKDIKENYRKVFFGKKVFIDSREIIYTKECKNFLQKQSEQERLLFCAAYDICKRLAILPKDFIQAYKSFTSLPHRVEFIAEINGISFYNDSKATNVEATIFAVKKIKNPIFLIAGGVDKNLSYKKWNKELKTKVKKVFAIGRSAEKIKKELADMEVEIINSMEEAVILAYKQAKIGDVVLLSPGAASFDMFRNYADRGEKFKHVVASLQTLR